MKNAIKLLTIAMFSTAAVFSSIAGAPNAFAWGTKFSSSLQKPDTPITIKVKLSEDLQYRANNISKDIRDRSVSRGLNNGFSGNGYFGEKDLNRLAERLKRKMSKRLEKSGIEISENAPTVLELVIIDAKPNRPTFTQMAKSVGLSFNSIGIGGAEFEGRLYSQNADMGEISYGWYENDIRDSQYGGTWTDANRAIDRFARKTAKALAGN